MKNVTKEAGNFEIISNIFTIILLIFISVSFVLFFHEIKTSKNIDEKIINSYMALFITSILIFAVYILQMPKRHFRNARSFWIINGNKSLLIENEDDITIENNLTILNKPTKPPSVKFDIYGRKKISKKDLPAIIVLVILGSSMALTVSNIIVYLMLLTLIIGVIGVREFNNFKWNDND